MKTKSDTSKKNKSDSETLVSLPEIKLSYDQLLQLNEDLALINEKLTLQLENAAEYRTKQLELKNLQLERANKELFFQNGEKEKRAAELNIANKELAFQNEEKEKRATELSIANEELAFQNNEKEKRAAELSVANKDLTSFTYISSHDLQEPLRKIQNFASLILQEEEKNLSETGKGYFSRMTATANRMQQLIEDLLKYSRAKSGEQIFEKTDLNLLLNNIKKDFEESLKTVKGNLEYNTFPEINVIPFQFRQLFHNLIGNAIKFAKQDIPLQIKITATIAAGSKLNYKLLSPKKKYYHLVFEDNGIGFEPQYKERIFEVFQRLHSKEAYAGTGIGLAICKRIVENHNGIIEAEGALGKGVKFDIYLLVKES